ncbi:hypothetical protein DZF91_00850 [Actinomadura logoneensis]|uniref:Uncharacterized protein n=1 Tax=Actinomadura logoneensis TaxID=2293572 RepID=A0A372JUK4_9ACTN|nr:hypothetical protein [Actinomadura logoneensis]RFU43486.1 hypothetical protein DZF91_00850 [Actinomadura logoneensis]
MSRSLISRIGPRKSIAVLASAGALATAGTLVFGGPSNADTATPGTSAIQCSNATLKGHYIFGANGTSAPSSGATVPISTGGLDHFDGKGGGTGIATFVVKDSLVNDHTPITLSYNIKSDCSGKASFHLGDSSANFNVYADPSGASFVLVATDPGNVLAGTETRVSR